MNFLKRNVLRRPKKCSKNTNHMVNVIKNVELALNANAGAGNFKWEDMDVATRQGKLVDLMEKNEFDLNCAYKNPKNKGIIDAIRDSNPVPIDELKREIVYLGVIHLFIKNKETPKAKLGGRRRRTKKRKSRRRRKKRTKKKRRRKSRRRRRR